MQRISSLLLLIALFAMSTDAYAASGDKIRLHFKNGSTVDIALVDREGDPIMVRVEPEQEWDSSLGELVPTGRTMVDFGSNHYYSFDDLNKYTFETRASSIENVPSISDKPHLTFLNESTIKVSNARPGSRIRLINTGGITLLNQKADSSGESVISLANLTSGMYILITDNYSFKFIKK